MRLLECPWLQQQHKSSVESCIRTLAMVGKEPLLGTGDRGQSHPGLSLPSSEQDTLSLLWGHHSEGLPAGNGNIQLWDVLLCELHLSTARTAWG